MISYMYAFKFLNASMILFFNYAFKIINRLHFMH